MIVEEYPIQGTLSIGEYFDDYIILSCDEGHKPNIGDVICLELMLDEGFPQGGNHGEGYDIIEELT